MSKLIWTDPHINEKSIPELERIFREIYRREADELLMLGDYFDSKRPTAKEIIFGTKWAILFKEKYKRVIFLRGNHDKTKDISAIDYLQYLGIEVLDDYVDEDNNFYGHFMTNESKFEYGTYKYTIKELKEKYNKVYLGHQHSFQELLKNRFYHISSCRYVSFAEVSDESKYIVRLGEKEEFLPLQSPIKMVDVKSINELIDRDFEHCKVRLIISSFDQFKREINQIPKYKNKYPEFKLKLQFNDIGNDNYKKIGKMEVNKHKNLQTIITQYIDKIEDKEVKELLKGQIK